MNLPGLVCDQTTWTLGDPGPVSVPTAFFVFTIQLFVTLIEFKLTIPLMLIALLSELDGVKSIAEFIIRDFDVIGASMVIVVLWSGSAENVGFWRRIAEVHNHPTKPISVPFDHP